MDSGEETIVRFDGLLAYIPTLIRLKLGKGEGIEGAADRTVTRIDRQERIEGILPPGVTGHP